ncbi:MAG: hypothetical protein HQL87_01690 [Magnetococcales bacterium]|nr:hypothetical protein [Magnetococcales bacterium]
MRALVSFLLGLLVIGGAFYGLRLLWYAIFPFQGESAVLTGKGGRPVLSPWERRVGWVLLLVVVLLFVLMVVDRLRVDGETPTDWTVSPPVRGRTTVPDHRY